MRLNLTDLEQQKANQIQTLEALKEAVLQHQRLNKNIRIQFLASAALRLDVITEKNLTSLLNIKSGALQHKIDGRQKWSEEQISKFERFILDSKL